MVLYIRILWGLLNANKVPRDLLVRQLNEFHQQLTKSQLYSSQASRQELIPCCLVQIGTAMSAKQGCIAQQASFLEENMLDYV